MTVTAGGVGVGLAIVSELGALAGVTTDLATREAGGTLATVRLTATPA